MRCFHPTIFRSSWVHRNSLITKLCYSVSEIHLDQSNVWRPEDPITRRPKIEVTGDIRYTGSNESLPVESSRRQQVVSLSSRKDGLPLLSPKRRKKKIVIDKRPKNNHNHDLVKVAFERYLELHGDLVVPYLYRIPDDSDLWPKETHGMRLGVVASKVRRGTYYQPLKNELAIMGMNVTHQIRPLDGETLKLCLLRFKEIYGSMRVPFTYSIPNDDTWPERARGMKLGIMASTIRRGKSYKYLHDELVGMGFDYSYQKRHHGAKSVLTALKHYKKLYGDLLVPTVFRIPVNSPTEDWPEDTWDMNLGSIVGSIRGAGCYVGMREKLEEIGFDYTSQKVVYGDDSVRLALHAYKEYNGDLLISPDFIIPSNKMWPEEVWDMKLGLVVKNIRRGKSYISLREELEEMGLDYSLHHRYYGKDLVSVALTRYKEIHGDLLVKANYRIPSYAVKEDWPEDVWGMRLGSAVSSIRGGKCYVSSKEEFTSMGFDYSKQKVHYGASTVLQALTQYQKLYGNFAVPSRFCIPYDSYLWPRETWGMKLGILKRNLRNGNCYTVLREELSGLGFQYRPEEGLDDEDMLLTPLKPKVIKPKRRIGPKIRAAKIDSQAVKDKVEAKRLRSELIRKAKADAIKAKADAKIAKADAMKAKADAIIARSMDSQQTVG